MQPGLQTTSLDSDSPRPLGESFYGLRVLILVIGSHNAMVQKTTKEGLDPAYCA